MLLQDAAPHQWPHHRAAVRAWLVRTRPSLAGIGPRSARHGHGPAGKQAGLGDIARVGALMTQLEVDLETELGRRLVAWAMGRGKGWGGDEPKLKNLTLRIGRWMRKLGIVSTGSETHAIRSYKNAEEDGYTHKYAVRVENLVDAVIG